MIEYVYIYSRAKFRSRKLFYSQGKGDIENEFEYCVYTR